MKILGISAYYHDSAACFLEDGVVRIAVQEERFTRKKHDPGFPKESIDYILNATQLKITDFDAVVYYEKPWIKFDRILESYIRVAPFGLRHFVESFPLWIKQKLFLKQELAREFKKWEESFDSKKLLFSEHHLSHAASAYYPSPFEEALVLTCDGVGEWATFSVGVAKGSHLEIREELHFPHSLGLLYSTLTAYCGFKVNSGEYKVMGLAPYGVPRFSKLLSDNLVVLDKDGSFSLNMKFFDFISGTYMHSHELEKLLGFPARHAESPLEQIHMDLAASLQVMLEEILAHMLDKLYHKYKIDNLCLAGGVALNCVANSKIKNQGLFKNVWVQPAAGDAGGSWGAALAAYHMHFQQENRAESIDRKQGVYLGPSFTEQEITEYCKSKNIPHTVLSRDQVTALAVQHLEKGDALGWFQGAMEFGPRALGSRSIIADARKQDMQKRLNLKVKFRESFRPFAPIVRKEDVSEYFEWNEESPYMMFVANVKDKWRIPEPDSVKSAFGIERLNFARSQFPAITHLDYSARLQTVSAAHNPRLHELLTEFKSKTGSGVLVNTSFNVRGEPIVCTPEDAINCFLATDIDILILENVIIEKSKTAHLKIERQFELD